MVFLPKLTTAVPAPLVAIVALTVFTVARRGHRPHRRRRGQSSPTACPASVVPHVPLTLDTLVIIGPFALAMALVGLHGVAA